jgi:hypothetical protein
VASHHLLREFDMSYLDENVPAVAHLLLDSVLRLTDQEREKYLRDAA